MGEMKVTRSYSITLNSSIKVEELAKNKGLDNSKMLNKMIEEYNG